MTNKERMAIDRHPMLEQEPERRSHNFEEVNLGCSVQLAAEEAERCILCPAAPCVAGCPEGNLAGASESLLGDNALPSVTGRVCPQEIRCEQVCARAKNGRPVAVGYLERFVADWAGAHPDELAQAVVAPSGRRIAIVGAGPAGLTAAGELAKSGHRVTIFEAFHAPGGVLLYGIPDFRLPKAIVEREAQRRVILAIGDGKHAAHAMDNYLSGRLGA